MASYDYQYGTSARKLVPEEKTPKKSPKKAVNKKNSKKTEEIKSKQYQDKLKAKEAKVARTNFTILMVIALGCILLLMYRNVKIRERMSIPLCEKNLLSSTEIIASINICGTSSISH